MYSKVKGKILYFILAPATFAKLKRLAIYRLAGYNSAPITLAALIGFSMPCALTFSMAEMYVPDKLKLPCKIMKLCKGFAFYGLCYRIDYVAADFEKTKFGQELQLNAPELMGTFPTKHDIDELREFSKKK